MAVIDQVLFPQISSNISQYFTDKFIGIEHLLPAEFAIVEGAVDKRRTDFSTGRYCARQALKLFVNSEPEILQGKSREPLWPDGIVGSISHSNKLVGAVVALQKDVTAIGLDIETIGGVKPDMWNMIFHDEEQELIYSKQGETDIWATLLFSLKETFYKMQYPVTGLFLDFLDISILEIEDRLCFKVKNSSVNLQPVGLSDVRIYWTLVDDQLLSVCYISAK